MSNLRSRILTMQKEPEVEASQRLTDTPTIFTPEQIDIILNSPLCVETLIPGQKYEFKPFIVKILKNINFKSSDYTAEGAAYLNPRALTADDNGILQAISPGWYKTKGDDNAIISRQLWRLAKLIEQPDGPYIKYVGKSSNDDEYVFKFGSNELWITLRNNMIIEIA